MNIKTIFKKIDNDMPLSQEEVEFLLSASGDDMSALYEKADSVRREYMGDEIFLRGIIEFSNFCTKKCLYCGINSRNDKVARYRMSDEEILEVCRGMLSRGQTTAVLQSGEDPFYTKEKMAGLIKAIKKETSLAVTLSVGERDRDTYALWKDAGMDRYLLRFETSDEELFRSCHPDSDLKTRVKCLRDLKSLGVQTGSGFLIGLPGETIQQLARDILFCTSLSLDMIGVGPFIPHGDTGFGLENNPFPKDVFFKTVSILRLLNKIAHIPSTTAFDAIDPDGRNLLLERGCNVFMPNATPGKYRKHYLLYPGKPCVDESSEDCASCVIARITSLGRKLGKGPGHSLRK
ncbi:MAG TPA: [FeFe] hydrogenase H-cluster radical SAM maturase HydE [Candidatus Omnitrophota bacterium]|nr:[FeFe] hydrogenase H-cluster radical SAM maturase HydE [Candidatus Omnitrophota bacterium]